MECISVYVRDGNIVVVDSLAEEEAIEKERKL
jgi:hypothetical protein